MDPSDNRTEKPTQKRLNEARKKGDTPFSIDLFRSSYLFMCIFALWAYFHHFFPLFTSLFQFQHLNSRDPFDVMRQSFSPFLMPTLSLLLLFFLLIFLLHFIQRGYLFVEKREVVSAKSHRIYEGMIFLLKGLILLFTPLFLWKKIGIFPLTLTLLVLLVILGIFDFIMQKKFWNKKMMMTKEELLAEQREEETSPHMKERMRKK